MRAESRDPLKGESRTLRPILPQRNSFGEVEEGKRERAIVVDEQHTT